MFYNFYDFKLVRGQMEGTIFIEPNERLKKLQWKGISVRLIFLVLN